MTTSKARHPRQFSRRFVLNALGIILLSVGTVVAATVYWNGLRQPDGEEVGESAYEDGTLQAEDSKRISRDVEMTWGKLGLLNEKLGDWMTRLEKPKSLAILVGVFSVFAGGTCFFLARQFGSNESPK